MMTTITRIRDFWRRSNKVGSNARICMLSNIRQRFFNRTRGWMGNRSIIYSTSLRISFLITPLNLQLLSPILSSTSRNECLKLSLFRLNSLPSRFTAQVTAKLFRWSLLLITLHSQPKLCWRHNPKLIRNKLTFWQSPPGPSGQ